MTFLINKTQDKILALLRDIIFVLSFAILTGILAKFKIEIGTVPITGQTFAVLLSGAIKGALSTRLSFYGFNWSSLVCTFPGSYG